MENLKDNIICSQNQIILLNYIATDLYICSSLSIHIKIKTISVKHPKENEEKI